MGVEEANLTGGIPAGGRNGGAASAGGKGPEELKKELASFSSVWEGGYYDADPLQPDACCWFHQLGYINVLHATYLRCIRPYVRAGTVALEIGPGRGAFTRALLGAKEVWALDALSAEHNGFYEYVGRHPHVRYYQVPDFSCSMLPENHFDFLFSFACLCHVSFEGITQYARNLFGKLRPGANCFWMVADYEQYNAAVAKYNVWRQIAATAPPAVRPAFDLLRKVGPLAADVDDKPTPGRWYHAGTAATCAMLEANGYEILDSDVGTCLRDPVIHFRRP